jgi:hypothetical protein
LASGSGADNNVTPGVQANVQIVHGKKGESALRGPALDDAGRVEPRSTVGAGRRMSNSPPVSARAASPRVMISWIRGSASARARVPALIRLISLSAL